MRHLGDDRWNSRDRAAERPAVLRFDRLSYNSVRAGRTRVTEEKARLARMCRKKAEIPEIPDEKAQAWVDCTDLGIAGPEKRCMRRFSLRNALPATLAIGIGFALKSCKCQGRSA